MGPRAGRQRRWYNPPEVGRVKAISAEGPAAVVLDGETVGTSGFARLLEAGHRAAQFRALAGHAAADIGAPRRRCPSLALCRSVPLGGGPGGDQVAHRLQAEPERS
jgi:hypothetical protein